MKCKNILAVLLSFEDSVQDLTQVCLNNGGGIQ